ncbi:hypothetical protein MVA47_07880 [Williamsia sp. DF01-3]|nr:hypothetical protein [Williamsia sp. DF01-3]
MERDNPNYGDERNFLIVKEASFAGAGGWTDALDVVPDNEYLLRAYIHNGAADTEENVARDTNVRFELPTCAGTAIALQGVITSPAAYPQMIWDTAILTARETLRVELVPGSAQQFNNRFPDGVSLPDRVATSGATVGSATADGDVRGDYRNSVIVSARVRTVSE